MLRLENITKRFGPVVANRGVSLEVRKGEVLALLGENGAGKTTLVSILYGLYAPDEGRILLEGKEVRIPSPRAAQRLGIALVPQHPELIEAHSVAENLALRTYPRYARLGLLDYRAMEKDAEDLIARHRIQTPSPKTPVRFLSGGNVQKVILARELREGPRLLLAMHPTYGVDVGAAEEVHARLLGLVREGAAVLLVSEDLDEILALSHRVAAMYRGRLVGPIPREAASPERLGRMMTEGRA